MNSVRFLKICIALAIAALIPLGRGAAFWSSSELQMIESLRLGSNANNANDPTNALANDAQAANIGYQLFYDKRLSSEGDVACATCHNPEKTFTDGKILSEGVGRTNRNAPTIVGASHNIWQFWDGRADSLWQQALGPLENPSEHGFSRVAVAKLVAKQYRSEFETVFGPMPDFEDDYRFPENASPVVDNGAQTAWNQMTESDRAYVNTVFVNVGKAIEAFERQIQPGRSRFDQYAESLKQSSNSDDLNSSEIAGLRLFIGKAGCVTCHSGSQFSDGKFHNTGVPRNPDTPLDQGREEALGNLFKGEFSCKSTFSDAVEACPKDFQPSTNAQLVRAYKTPSLRTAATTAPYMHAGQFGTLAQVILHYRNAPKPPLGTTELRPVTLTNQETLELEAFLRSLNAPIDAPAQYLQAPRDSN
jgi:cytochrome c peroxidase